MGDSDILSNRPRFNRPTHDYVFTGSQFRGGNDLTSVRFSKGTNFIDICNGGIDISSSNVKINNNLQVSGDTTIGGALNITGSTTFSNITGNNFTINGDLSVNSMLSNILKVPSTFTLDPAGHGDITGKVIILGDLQVDGTTTTINSSVVDISDKMITLASNASNSTQADGGGFKIGGVNAEFIYNHTNTRFQSSIGLGVSGNLLPINNVSQIPVSFNTYELVTSNLGSAISNLANTWEPIANYTISKVVLSNHSYIKMEFKVNFISSTEADQTLGFRVERNISATPSWTTVYTDPSLGSNMGIGFINVYNGTFIDNLAGQTLNANSITNNVTYRLLQRRNLNTTFDNAISTDFGVIGGTGVGNYIFLQELYRPS
jgi:hypothetical protein